MLWPIGLNINLEGVIESSKTLHISLSIIKIYFPELGDGHIFLYFHLFIQIDDFENVKIYIILQHFSTGSNKINLVFN